MFEKTQSDLLAFASDLNAWAEGRNQVIDQLYAGLSDAFAIAQPGSSQMNNS